MKKVLYLLSQRPHLTGSGITLHELLVNGTSNNWEQEIICGIPKNATATVGNLPDTAIHTLEFESEKLPFPVPGMSDVMPYRSTVWSTMSAKELNHYKEAWTEIIKRTVNTFQPDIIHTNHIWIMSSLIKQLFPHIPVTAHCHATGLRQMELCPSMKDEVIEGCRKIDHFAVLHSGHQKLLSENCGISPSKISVVGAGYNPDIFHCTENTRSSKRIHIAYAGKYSLAKGLDSLLNGLCQLDETIPWTLHVAGKGDSDEANQLKNRMEKMSDRVILYGQLDQTGLAEMFNTCSIVALPSFYEGLPLILIEALACGCRIVCTKLEGICDNFVPVLKDYMTLIDLPKMVSIDKPDPTELPAFEKRIALALEEAMKKPPLKEQGLCKEHLSQKLKCFTWSGVFKQVESIWNSLLKRENS